MGFVVHYEKQKTRNYCFGLCGTSSPEASGEPGTHGSRFFSTGYPLKYLDLK